VNKKFRKLLWKTQNFWKTIYERDFGKLGEKVPPPKPQSISWRELVKKMEIRKRIFSEVSKEYKDARIIEEEPFTIALQKPQRKAKCRNSWHDDWDDDFDPYYTRRDGKVEFDYTRWDGKIEFDKRLLKKWEFDYPDFNFNIHLTNSNKLVLTVTPIHLKFHDLETFNVNYR
jgi:hypothetical protein